MKTNKGFTLVELLVAIGILGVLISILVVAVVGMQGRAKGAKTKGIILSLETAVQNYYETYKDYPPDGYDNPGQSKLGGRTGSGALVYLLGRRMTYSKPMGAKGASYEVTEEVGPFLKDIKSDMLTFASGSDKNKFENDPTDFFNNVTSSEFKDGWGRPIEYDRLDENGGPTYLGQGDHKHPGRDSYNTHHAKDPRKLDKTILDMSNDYFLWSNGRPEDEAGWTPEPIGSWNMKK